MEKTGPRMISETMLPILSDLERLFQDSDMLSLERLTPDSFASSISPKDILRMIIWLTLLEPTSRSFLRN
jgi:hypothetical protein